MGKRILEKYPPHYTNRDSTVNIIALLIVVSLAEGNQTEIILLKEIRNSLTTEASVTANIGVNSTTSSTAESVMRTSVIDSTISYLSGDILGPNTDRGFLVSHFHFSDSRWGPFFEEGPEPHNITARIGSTVVLDCRIGLLHDKTVTWIHHKNDSIHLLTVGRNAYSSDERITLSFRYPNNWRLEIVYVTHQDQGLYECQVATHPPKVKRLFLKIIAPEIEIVDDLGRKVTERYYKVGSNLELTCIASQLENHSKLTDMDHHQISWQHGDQTIAQGISYNFSVNTNTVISTLTIVPLNRSHSGNYSCIVYGQISARVSVHILNDEMPAAVYHGNSAANIRRKNDCLITLPILLILLPVTR